MRATLRNCLWNHFCLILIFFSAAGSSVYAQMTAFPCQIALGGGIAYTSGTAAHFGNPANLMIGNHTGQYQVTVGLGGLYTSEGLRIPDYYRFPGQIRPFFIPDEPAEKTGISETELQRMFAESNRYQQTHSYDIIPIGLSWTDGSKARSFAMRSRGLSSFEMNQNWFEPAGEPDHEESVVRFLNENYQVFHEISLGFAREVTMLNQWHAGLNTLYIGLSPKLMLGAMHSQIRFESGFLPGDQGWRNSRYLEARTAGDMNRFLADLIFLNNAEQAFRKNLSPSSNFKINGVGLGLDAGITYIIPLGDDISLSPHYRAPLRKSLRFSLALTDLGAVRFQKDAGDWHSHMETETIISLPVSGSLYKGKPGELFRYLYEDSAEDALLDYLTLAEESSFYVQLPTELHIGAAFQYNWFVSLMDMNYRFNSPDFKKDGWRLSLGTEIRLHRFFPLLGSIQMNPGGNVAAGAGAGIDLGFAKATGAVRLFRTESEQAEWRLNSISGLALQIRF